MSVTFDFNFWTVVFCLFNASMNIYLLIATRSSQTQSKLQTLEVAVATLTANQSNAIKHDDLAAVYKQLEDIASTVNIVKGQLDIFFKKDK